jgi:phospholipase/lecithinase/hemolysin
MGIPLGVLQMLKHLKKSATTFALLLLMVCYASSAHSQPFTELVVFGDSHSDTGNWAEVTTWELPPLEMDPSYLIGRFSNGPVWVEEVAAQLGLTLPTPSEAGGLNYAWGAARTGLGFDPGGEISIPKVGSQVDQFLSSYVPGGDELVSIFAGHNDFGWGGETDPSIPALNIGDHITALATAGIGHFLVPNLHPLGHLPAYRGTSSEATLNVLTTDFNELLSTELESLETDLGVTIFQYDFSSFVQDVIEDPTSFGLINVTDTAFSNGVVVSNPNEYLYWDTDHFTTTFYTMMGQRAASLVVADFDVDGDTDGNDFLTWQRGEVFIPLSQSYLDAWQTNFGITSASTVTATIPEPTTLLLAMLGIASACCWRRRR